MFQSQSQVEYGKPELVELLTGVKDVGSLGWLTAARESDVIITATDMLRVHEAVLSYERNRIRNYGEKGEYTLYFAPAFEMIKQGFAARDFGVFKEGCELLLGLIGND